MLTATPVAADDPALRSTLDAAELPTEDLAEPGRTFFRFDRGDQLVGFGGFELYGPDVLLRSVVVVPELQGIGYGKDITVTLLGLARQAGAERAYLLTTTASEFFARLGFAPVIRAEAPDTIRSTHQAATICSTASMLSRCTAQ